MKTSVLSHPEFARRLRTQAVVEPPPSLRDLLLRRHRRRLAFHRSLPVLGMLLALATVSFLLPERGNPAIDTDWQQRSAELESAWREREDRTWLREDARAQYLLRQLRRVDHALDLAYVESSDAGHRNRLWRERSEALSALILSRQQGGVAVRL